MPPTHSLTHSPTHPPTHSLTHPHIDIGRQTCVLESPLRDHATTVHAGCSWWDVQLRWTPVPTVYSLPTPAAHHVSQDACANSLLPTYSCRGMARHVSQDACTKTTAPYLLLPCNGMACVSRRHGKTSQDDCLAPRQGTRRYGTAWHRS